MRAAAIDVVVLYLLHDGLGTPDTRRMAELQKHLMIQNLLNLLLMFNI